ncbi:Hypothetical predicted protein [Lecanosticta acicola]|uniref:GDP/GTP exchange factor Sec2 N-terminal domain-containing protein n=1 Tax=Lecanosticta acicola TaxID=111012 RepID=A0AAI8YS74_9PEZI|nr:Hypothetical predicted protein [Lecanosticta acicola]
MADHATPANGNGNGNGYIQHHVAGPRRVLHDSAHDSSLDVETKAEQMMRMRVKDLEEQNAILAEKATSASQRFADYENEIRVLKTRMREQQERHNTASSIPPTPDSEHSPAAPPPGLSRFGSFMRKPPPAPSATPTGPTAREQELEASFAKEQRARAEAEKKVKDVNLEVEELSVTLFQQANDMVAAERKENAALKEKIKALESGGGGAAEAMTRENQILKQRLQVMEQRELDRRRRLEKLEAAQKRIDRVRTVLVPP